MIHSAKLIPLLFIINAITVQNDAVPTLRVLDSNSMPISDSYVVEGTTVFIECRRGMSTSDTLAIHTKATSNASQKAYAGCYSYGSSGGPMPWTTTPVVAECGSNTVTGPLMLNASTPAAYQCVEGLNSQPDDILSLEIPGLKTYKIPDKPQIDQNESLLMEGKAVKFTCWSKGRPLPLLRFQFVETTRIPITSVPIPLTGIITSGETPEGNSTLTWEVTSTGDMNGKILRCEIYDHVSNANKYVDTELSVIYGPANMSNDLTRTPINLETVDRINITCGLMSNPAPEVTWYNSSSGDQTVSGKDPLILNKADYDYVTRDMTVMWRLRCEARNPHTGETAYHEHELTFETTKAAQANQGPEQGTPYYVWILVALGIVCVVVVVVIVVIFLRRRATSSPEKKKKKVFRESVKPATTPTPSAPSDIIREPKQDPPSTLDYRKSQNVEDYANAISMQPRSRKPIAFNEGFDDLESNPSHMESGGPPAYSATDSPGDYMTKSAYQPDPSYQQDAPYHTGTYDSADPYHQYNTYQPQQMHSPNGSYNMGYGAPC